MGSFPAPLVRLGNFPVSHTWPWPPRPGASCVVSQCHANALGQATAHSAASAMSTRSPHCTAHGSVWPPAAGLWSEGDSAHVPLHLSHRVLLLATEDVQSKASLLGKINPNGTGKYALPLVGEVQSPLAEEVGACTGKRWNGNCRSGVRLSGCCKVPLSSHSLSPSAHLNAK